MPVSTSSTVCLSITTPPAPSLTWTSAAVYRARMRTQCGSVTCLSARWQRTLTPTSQTRISSSPRAVVPTRYQTWRSRPAIFAAPDTRPPLAVSTPSSCSTCNRGVSRRLRPAALSCMVSSPTSSVRSACPRSLRSLWPALGRTCREPRILPLGGGGLMSVVTTLSALKENSPQEFEVDGIDVVLVRTDGEVFAVGATCTHAEVPMVDGEVVDCGLECYMHGSFFDLRTGEPRSLPATEPLSVYPVTIDGDNVLVDVANPITKES